MHKPFFVILLVFIFCAAGAEPLRFTPHTTTSARTLERHQFGFQRASGNMNSSFLMNSLMYGLWSRFEIGTAPIFYLHPDHRWNASAKLNFWRGQYVDWALGYSDMEFKAPSEVLEYFPGRTLKFKITSHQLHLNLHPPQTKFSLALTGGVVIQRIRGYGLAEARSLKSQAEWGADLSYPLRPDVDVTAGLGSFREFGISADEEVEFGFGTTIALYRPEKFFSKPSVGVHYLPHNDSYRFYFSSTFY